MYLNPIRIEIYHGAFSLLKYLNDCDEFEYILYILKIFYVYYSMCVEGILSIKGIHNENLYHIVKYHMFLRLFPILVSKSIENLS